MKFIIEWIVLALAVMLAAFIVPGASVSGFWIALWASILIALVNTTLGTILRIFTFPINILTLGLMSFIITVLMIMLVDRWMDSFHVGGFLNTVLFAVILAVIKMLFSKITD